MARKRMLSNEIVDSDMFLSLSKDAQLLYFHLNMHADDDGFINNANRIAMLINVSHDALDELVKNKYLIYFESSKVYVIKHWRINNDIKKDRHKSTNYQEEFDKLEIKENRAYTLSKKSINRQIIDFGNFDNGKAVKNG